VRSKTTITKVAFFFFLSSAVVWAQNNPAVTVSKPKQQYEAAFAAPTETSCTDGVDNDDDGLVDCADPDCACDPACAPPTETSCSDGVDNDCDGLVDCDDPDCVSLCALLVPVDIKPRSCPNPLNVNERGVVPVAILGSKDLDVMLIDPASVHLEGVPPLRFSFGDEATPFESITGKEDCLEDCFEGGPDGYLDLKMKYDAQEIVAALGEVEGGECRVIRITGSLKDEHGGTPLKGEDVALILKRNRSVRGVNAERLFENTFIRGDANADGDVDISDSIFTLEFLFLGGPLPLCSKATDSNDDGEVDISDFILDLHFLFLGSVLSLPSPYPGCAWDPSPDALSCESMAICNGS